MDTIGSFDGEHHFLSNFYPAEIMQDNLCYPTSEHLYQAMKASTEAAREWVRNAPSPAAAKSRGQQVERVRDWMKNRLDTMRKVLRAKFEQHPELVEMLLATGNTELVEGNTWGDTFWGQDITTGLGKNHLGKLLMELRSSLND